eukprot:7379132-Prymnesium_polylepis.1
MLSYAATVRALSITCVTDAAATRCTRRATMLPYAATAHLATHALAAATPAGGDHTTARVRPMACTVPTGVSARRAAASADGRATPAVPSSPSSVRTHSCSTMAA